MPELSYQDREKIDLLYRIAITEMSLDSLSVPERRSFTMAYRTFLRGIFDEQEDAEKIHEKAIASQKRLFIIVGAISSVGASAVGTIVGIVVGHIFK